MYKVVKYGRWLWAILDQETGLYVKKECYKDCQYAYINGETTFMTFKKKEEAEKWIEENKGGHKQ